MARLELERGTDVLLLETGDALLLELGLYVIDSYVEANRDNHISIKALHPSAGGLVSALGQSFTGDGRKIGYVQFHIKKTVGSPVGELTARLYAISGTFGTSNVPAGAVLASSSPMAIEDIGAGDFELVTFTFDGGFTVANGSQRCIICEVSSVTLFDTFNYIQIGVDATSPTHGGNSIYYWNGGWVDEDNWDAIFYFYALIPQAVGEGSMAIAGTLGLLTKLSVGSGSITIAGTLNRLIKISVGAGSIAISGALSSALRFLKAVGDGSVAISGALNIKTLLSVGAGSIAIAGTLGRVIKLAVGDGSIAIAGSLGLKIKIAVGDGAVAIAGTLIAIRDFIALTLRALRGGRGVGLTLQNRTLSLNVGNRSLSMTLPWRK